MDYLKKLNLLGLCAILGNHLDPFHGLFQEVDAIGFMCNIWSCQELIKFNLMMSMMSFEYIGKQIPQVFGFSVKLLIMVNEKHMSD